jgi:uncharacterized damage-inducible protein DinB
MDKTTRTAVVANLVSLLTEANAHVTFEQACAEVPTNLLNEKAPGLPYTVWQLAEHLRIAQLDILEFSRNPAHESPEWPAGYWPAPDATTDEAGWQATLAAIRHDQTEFIALLHDETKDLLAPFAHGTGQTLLREALLIADHNAYHTGQIVLLRRLLGDWE